MATKRNSTQQNSAPEPLLPSTRQEFPPLGLIAMSLWLRGIGRSDTTGWRWVQAGWLNPLNIAGRPYLTVEDIRRFQERAAAGEFAKAPAGAAKNAADARQAREAKP